MYTDREAMKRQSNVLLSAVTADTRLTQALMQIEELTQELEGVKQENKEKVRIRLRVRLRVRLYNCIREKNKAREFLE